ncbi:signal peptide peptidase SppA [Muribacter muris]|uniref:Signal peptide peptidase SppA n=1 Tax=Muribacter muris TaxID=67855 RepID=A0A4Y9K8D7_9PAST|nr:signal peptide peptidase SppA [Muribacter muris]MBF0783985.1 signal peptide peptidase SppA [Muribacter muris]MBF0827466.1 signal peptide peptidase SppA [Muribacter muris]TFV13380.1 signal peptide peptidase SppA [Muribacter muris]
MLSVLKGLYQVFRCIREFVLSLFFILFVLVLFALASVMSGGDKKNAPIIIDQGALTLNLDGYLADNHDEFSEFNRFINEELTGQREPLKISTFDVVQAIAMAKTDDRVTGLVLDLAYFHGGDMPSLQYIGEAIEDFKTAQKPVIAVGNYFSQQQYYLASYADKIYLNRAGFVDLHGLSYSNLYFKSLFDKIEAVPHIFRVGTYKSAVEPFMRNDMSPEARQNAQLWLDKLWRNMSQDIAENRHIKAENVVPETARFLAEYKAVKGNDAHYALKQQLVTDILTQQEIQKILVQHFGKNSEGSYNSIDFFDYVSQLPNRFEKEGLHRIAVINVEGAIMTGDSDDQTAGSDTIVSQLKKARQDDKVKGVILRINSPGGSAMASELIRQEVENVQSAGKPVVVSMGGMAASGGYWIAATSDKIVAQPTTLTGSIGIFGLAVTFEKTAKKLGISEDGIATSPLANQSAFKTLSKEQGDVIQIGIENGYQRFLDLVSRGRKMTTAEVDKIAQGQVWLGESALEKGLVDKLGSFNDAHELLIDLINEKRKAKGKAAIERFNTYWIVEQRDDLLSQLMRDFKAQIGGNMVSWLGLSVPKRMESQLGQLAKFNDPQSRYLYCLNCGTLK